MHLYYFTREWWRYIFHPISVWQKGYFPGWWWIGIPLCRWRGHPAGIIWYNPGALEPDMRCRNCGDDLG